MSESERETTNEKKPVVEQSLLRSKPAVGQKSEKDASRWINVAVVSLAVLYFGAIESRVKSSCAIPISWREWRDEHDQRSSSTLIVVSFLIQGPIGFLRAFPK